MKGPAIIEEKESTIIVGEDAQAGVDAYGFVWITMNSGVGMRNAEKGMGKSE